MNALATSLRVFAVLSGLIVPSALAVAACGGDPGDGKHVPASAPSDEAGAAKPQAIKDIVSVDHIAIYQGVKVTLLNEAQVTAPNSILVPERPALLRIHAKTPSSRDKAPRVKAEVKISAPGHEDVIVTDGPRNIMPMEEGELSTTFSFELTAEQMFPGAQLSVTISDPTEADITTVRYPETGELPLNVGTLAPTLKVKFVPVKYKADGSDRMPQLDAKTMETYRKHLFKMYPVAKVDLSTRDKALDWPLEVLPDGEGWDSLLDAILETRADDQVADDLYYVGIFNPAENERVYCERGCVLGVAPRSTGDDVGLRVAMVVGYPTERSHGTLAQELAHAMGRMHAPCGSPAAIDKKYPYSSAAIGSWGYDLVDKELIDPDSRVFDFMSYCNPVWVSDYTFSAIYQHMVEVDAVSKANPTTPAAASAGSGTGNGSRTAKTFHVGKDGSLRPGPSIKVLDRSMNDLQMQTFTIENGSHQQIATLRGAFKPLDNIGGGLLIAPNDATAATLKTARFANIQNTK